MDLRPHFIALILISLSGCSVMTGISSAYPSKWPETSNVSAVCSTFAGTFHNEAEATYSPHGGSSFLTARFGMLGNLLTDHRSVDVVRIGCVGESALIAEAINSGNVVASTELRRSDGAWSIENAQLKFPSENLSGADELGGIAQWAWFSLMLSEDGSLIGKEVQRGAALALWIVPMGGSQTFWFKWLRASDG